MIRTIQLMVLFVSVLVASAGQVYAGFVTYTDKSLFMAALASSSTDNFDDLLGNYFTPITRTVGPYAYQAVAVGFDITIGNPMFSITNPMGQGSDVYLQPFDSVPMELTITGGGPTAMGGFFFVTDSAVSPTSGTISVSINGGLFTQSVTTSSATNFFGWVSTDGTQISSLDVSSTTSDTYASVNDFILGQANVSAVPEPTSLALFGIGACVAGVGAARRQRRDKKQAATV